ncbi:MAG TPA: PEGA domain-containing protein [Sandaracinaceae bacterium LLY-WYZ-13_1]|nr:PEGA domain-containing protein [Sandaracinaceae bacterium LLY-WYZ-13_1]
MRTVCTLALILLASPAVAAAQSALVVVPPAPVPPVELERARAGVIEVLAENGMRLVPTPDGEPCEAVECAPALARQAGADVVLLVSVEATEGGGSRIRVESVPADGDRRGATAEVGDAGFGAAAGAALQELLSEPPPTRRGFLTVRTTPPGAAVSIDGEAVGRAPLRRMVAPGEHAVRIAPAAGPPRERTVEVRPLEETAVEVDLGAEDEAPGEPMAETGPTRTEPSPFNWLLGGGLAIAGIVTLISPLQTLAQEGECVELVEDAGCVEMVRFGAQSGVLLGVGLALLTGAVIVDAVAPIRVEVQVSDSAGLVGVRGRF